MAKKVDFDKVAQGLFKRTEDYADKVRKHYVTAVDELLKLAAMYHPNGTSAAFSFADNTRLSNKANDILRQLYAAVYGEIQNGVKAEWQYANVSCDALIEELFGKGLKEDNHFARWFSRNQEAMDSFLKRKSGPGGLNLSRKIWKYTGDFRTEMETAISLSMGAGDSASTMSRKVRQYLEHPDDMFRRFRVKVGEQPLLDEQGNPILDDKGNPMTEPVYGRRWKKKVIDPQTGAVTWTDFDPRDYHTGRGVYRSSYKNAMRLTRTETNMAYRTAEQDRWQRLDFVVGYEVRTSNNHPDEDICDILKGRYPKNFTFRGWHPQCRCYCVPILATEEEFLNQQRMILDGEKDIPAGSVNEVTRLPKNFTDWIDDNKERIEEAEARGTLPYFITDNKRKKFNSQPLPIATNPDVLDLSKPKHQVKYQSAKNVLAVALNYPELDTSALTAYLSSGMSVTSIIDETKALAQKILAVKKDEKFLSALIPDVHYWKSQFTSSELHAVYDAVEKKLASLITTDLASLKKDLIFEIDWVEKQKKYSTWSVAKAAYEKKLADVEEQIKWKTVSDVLAEAKTFKTKSQPYLDLIKKLEADIAANDITSAQITVNEMQKKRDELKKKAAKRKSSSMGDSKVEKYCDKHRTFTSDVVDQTSFEEMQKRGINDCSAQWLASSPESRRAFADYTDGSYDSVNYSYWGNFTECYDGKLIDELLDNVKLSKDMVLRRGGGMKELQTIFGDVFYNLALNGDIAGLNKLSGHKGVNEGFISTSFDMEGGFGGEVNFVFFAPKGTHAIYAKPISVSQDRGGSTWDGVTARPYFSQGSENEFVVHRGYTYRFIKAQSGDSCGMGGKITIFVELITRKDRKVK